MRSRLWPLALVAVLILTIIVVSFACRRPRGVFRPSAPLSTPIGLIDHAPIPLTFEELNDDPLFYQNKLIRVSGQLQRLAPISCIPFKGPRPQWELVSDGLRMNVVGLEELARLAPTGARLVVDGIWRQYQGPLGCGKEPADDVFLYLEARLIVEPNPFVFGENVDLSLDDEPLDGEIPIATPTASLGEPDQPLPTTVGTAVATATLSLTNTPDELPTPSRPTPTLDPQETPAATLRAPTPTRPSQRLTPTPDNATPSPLGSKTPTPTPTDVISPATPTPGTGGNTLPTIASGTISAATPLPTDTPNAYGYD